MKGRMEMAENKVTFESALARLEEIVRAMESGSAALDSSLALFEEGIGLVKFCTKALDTAEQKVKILQKDENGELAEAPFAVKAGE
jgi:exodeoxyribonuclease VII small subunit